jgi:hypothetical protein
VSTASCAADASGACNCDSVAAATVTNTPGTYSISGDTVTTVQGSTTSVTAYCVQGGLLHEIPTANDGGLTSVAGDLVFTRE